jgi:starch phosphorylase
MSQIPYLPARIEGLAELATNLAWSWHRDVRALFLDLDDVLWHQTRHSPLELLRQVEPSRIAACASDPGYLARYDRVMARFHAEMGDAPGWFETQYPERRGGPVAYFCAEFGVHNSVPIYSGGLGVLAGDHCKSAADLHVPLVGVGLLYRKGYFDQHLRLDGWQESTDAQFDVEGTPLQRMNAADGTPWLAEVRTSGRDVKVGARRLMVGRVPIYLLDTDFEENHPDDRGLVSKLYDGGPTHRLRQEWILGVGGVRVLRAMGVMPAAWHANEGHAAFMLLERLREELVAGAPMADAVSRVRRSSVFTTHTPVAAGHDYFSFEDVAACAGPLWDDVSPSREEILGLGSPPDQPDQFHMTVLAIRLSTHINGVSRKHGQVSREIWRGLWPGRPAESVPIGHITNGVHLQTWMAAPFMEMMDGLYGGAWPAVDDAAEWDRVLGLEPERIWDAHLHLKGMLFKLIREDARWRFKARWKEASHVVGAGVLLDPSAFTIGFARRFATYKRADLLFHDVERLKRLVADSHRPVQIIFAGKAHPADDPGKQVLQKVYEFTRDPAFAGRVAFLEDYDMHLAHLLVQGVDLWLNLPRIPLEASGTSGMKAGLNGVPQLATLDGWWHEGFDGVAGWAIPAPEPSSDVAAVDAQDAARLYELLHDQIVPLFYARSGGDIPSGWVERMRHAIRLSASRFTARRMVQDYVRAYYVPSMASDPAGDDPPAA